MEPLPKLRIPSPQSTLTEIMEWEDEVGRRLEAYAFERLTKPEPPEREAAFLDTLYGPGAGARLIAAYKLHGPAAERRVLMELHTELTGEEFC